MQMIRAIILTGVQCQGKSCQVPKSGRSQPPKSQTHFTASFGFQAGGSSFFPSPGRDYPYSSKKKKLLLWDFASDWFI